MMYRHIPVTGGFSKKYLDYHSEPAVESKKSVIEGIDRGLRMLVSSTKVPLRFTNLLCIIGAFGNLLYSIYVILVAFFGENIAPGWASLSLQQSVMFALLSLVLLVLSEYILQVASVSNHGPSYHVAQEFTSNVMTRKSKLNIETAKK